MTRDNTRAFVALPVILAVLLVVLSMPVKCASAAAPSQRTVASAQAASVVSMPAMPGGDTLPHTHAMHADNTNKTHDPAPAPHKRPVPQPMNSGSCEHSIPTVLQPSAGVEQVKVLDIAVAAALPVAAPVVDFTVVMDDTPGDPPGVTLTASHLRI